MESAFRFAGLKVALAWAALALVAPANARAADLGGGPPIDDGWNAAAAAAAVVSPCYFRADLGYSWSPDPSSSYAGNPDPGIRAPSLSNGWFTEAGGGCGSGSRGLRGEVTLGLREAKDFGGTYTDSSGAPPVDGRLTATVRSYTMMFNGYYDLGKIGNAVPYVGAGIGMAYHRLGDVHSNVAAGVQPGDDKVSFAWSLMAGFGYQLTDRAILDIGYRYIDLGSAESSSSPRLEVADMTAHEFKIGLRYHFGTDAYAPVK